AYPTEACATPMPPAPGSGSAPGPNSTMGIPAASSTWASVQRALPSWPGLAPSKSRRRYRVRMTAEQEGWGRTRPVSREHSEYVGTARRDPPLAKDDDAVCIGVRLLEVVRREQHRPTPL